MSVFIKCPLDLKNQFTDDPLLKNLINEKIKSKYLHEITEDLTRFGEEVTTKILKIAEQAESEVPKLEGGSLYLSEAWRKLHDISAREGLISIGYESMYGAEARIYQFAKSIYLIQARRTSLAHQLP